MADTFQTNTKVEWEGGDGTGTGKVCEVFRVKVARPIQGAEVTRNASEDYPGYLLEQDDGGEVLKSRSELSRVS